MVEVYICKLPIHRGKAVLDKLLLHVPKERQNRIKRFRQIDDAYRSLIGDLMMRFIHKKRYGSIGWDLEVGTNKYGKPFLCQYPSFHYNISHSGEYVVSAVHEEEVGVDIEKVGPFDLNLVKGLFTEEECKVVMDTKEGGLASFYDIWTLKESYIKAIGKGLSLPLHFFNVRKYGPECIQLTDMQQDVDITDFTCRQYEIDSQYRLSVCAYQANVYQFVNRPIEVTFDEMSEGLGIIAR